MRRYNPKEIELKWQKKWADSQIFHVKEDADKPKKYVIDMFPYPSGAAMHVGHVRNFTISDVLSQYLRQKGYNVLHTMGWDTFGLPAENYAIKTGTPPQETTKTNIANFKHQLQQLGMSYDWSREVNTSDPEYYRWTQWIFTKLFENGLAYQKESLQWWCPHDKTVLANEQVEAGKCWRCGHGVVKKNLKQWFFKITDYADALLDGIDDLDWPEKIKTMQRNWIGRSIGAQISFQVTDSREQAIEVFTTRPDTIFGATFLVLAPEHELVAKVTTDEQEAAVEAYVNAAQKKSDIERQENKEKTGVFTGSYAINPANDEKISIWIADYVLPGYGTGAIMAVPAHDERDNEFAQKFDLPITFVVEPTFGEPQGEDIQSEKVYVILRNPKMGEVVVLDWGPRQENYGGSMLIGGTVEGTESYQETAEREIREETGYTNFEFVKESEFKGHGYFYSNTKHGNYHASGKGLLYDLIDETRESNNLDDGEKDKFNVTWQPIKKVAQQLDDGIHEAMFRYLVLEEFYTGEGDLINSGEYDGMSTSEARDKIVADLAKKGVAEEKTQYKIRDWLISRQRYWGAPIPIIHCDKDGAVAVPESDLPVILPEVKNYEPTGEGSVLASVPEWVNTVCPKCGGPARRETDTMDGYACSSWYFLRYTDPKNTDKAWDPAKANYWLPVDYYCGGDHAVSHLLYSRFWFHFFADQGWIEKTRREPVGKLVYNGYILAHDGNKMSKSKGNVVNPDDLISQGYGADSVRLFEMFIAPYDQNTSWNTNGVPGTFRFLQRFWTITQEFLATENDSKENEDVLRVTHRAIEQVSRDLDRLSFNTAVASLMETVNSLYKIKAAMQFSGGTSWRFAIESVTQMLAPFAPHIAEELWQQLGHESSVHESNWPEYNKKYLVSDSISVAVQVNGKLRGEVTVATDATEDSVIAQAREVDKVNAYLEGKEIVKTIYVQGKIVNFVVK